MKAPAASSENARNTMRGNRRVSALELRLRTALWASGARGYRVQSSLPGKPDVVFPVERVAILVHGCFWHVCTTCGLPKPKSNSEFWAAKFTENVVRDARVQEQLRSQGWEVVVLWEHQLRSDTPKVVDDLLRLRSERRAALGPRPGERRS